MIFKINGLLTVDNILKQISPLDIYKRYSSHFKKIGVHFKADFREDPNPSAIIYYYNGTYLYKDFGEDGALNCFQFVSRKFGLNFKEVLEKINNDFNLSLGGSGFGNINYGNINYNKSEVECDYFKTILTIKKREFKPHDLEWWNSQSWKKPMLKMANIKPISHFRLTSERKNIHDKLYLCDDYTYSMDYYWHNGIFRRKIYQPKNQKFKWLSNVDNTIVQGWKLLPKRGNIGFITSSFKDTGPFWRIYGKPVALASNNEGTWIPLNIWYKIKPRYNKWIIYYDNDDVGIKQAKKHSQMFGVPYIHNPLRAPKDPSDFIKSYNNPDDGLREFNYYLQKQLETI
jgi:hypothetical protein